MWKQAQQKKETQDKNSIKISASINFPATEKSRKNGDSIAEKNAVEISEPSTIVVFLNLSHAKFVAVFSL